ncbi:sugar transferase [Advenella sp. EE-W14]|uniref:sugar transferase n=1 Tax=Advenella sp. EE-W14 TaxID=2722705 RepID=UPI00145FC23E|nr:sugar transferase [Advenella sp. EE-W14]
MIKRIFDILASAIALLLLSPIIAIVAWQIRRKLGSPVLFRQVRPGLNGKPFTMVKFRTMRDAYDAQGDPLPDSERLTDFGRFLRKTSLDELPELWNILKGDMSIVGPRPLLTRYIPYYTEEESKRHNVRPGLTGLAQISGRNAITWEEKLALDVEYVKKINFLLDIKIIFKTIQKVFQGSDVLEAAPQGPLDKYREKLNEK